MEAKQHSSNNENMSKSPVDVLINLKKHYEKYPKVLRDITLKVDFTNDEAFFESLKTFLNDFEDAHIIEMLLSSSIKSIAEELDLYKLAEEAIIQTADRPVFLINNDQIEIPIVTKWEKHIHKNMASILKAIPSVGRIEIIDNGTNRKRVGTGWLLKGTDLIVTNKHVVNKFASSRGDTFYINEDSAGDTYSVRIDFKEEYATDDELEFDINEVKYISSDTELDIALLRVDKKNHNGDSLPEGLELSYTIPKKMQKIYVIGYPFCAEDEVKRNEHFNSVVGVKQFAPGEFSKTGIHKYLYWHDCTTWKGNSGSPVIDFETGKVLGIHNAGDSEEKKGLRTNYSVSGLSLVKILKDLKIQFNH